MRPLIAVYVVLTALSTSVLGDVRADIRDARKEHERRVRTARDRLEEAMLDAIKIAANTGQLEELQTILDAKVAFIETQEPPKVTSLEDAVETYLAARKQSAEKVNREYHKAIQTLVKFPWLKEVSASLREELDQFENSERLAIGQPTTKAPFPNKDTQVFVDHFIARFLGELKEISRLGTNVQRESEKEKLLAKFNKELGRKRLTFQCPIKNVTRFRKDASTYSLKLAAPLELKGMGQVSNHLSKTSLHLRESEALSISSNHVLKIRGVAKILQSSSRPDRKMYIFSINSPDFATYSIYVLNYKRDIRKVID